MKHKSKKTLAFLIAILVITLIGFTIVFAVAENTSSIANTVEDTNKTPAVLDSNYYLPYTARDIATYNNLYCVLETRALDGAIYYYNDIGFQATAMADIQGTNATFYKIQNGTLIDNGTVNCAENNIMAGIVAEPNPDSLFDSDIPIYKGYGALTVKNSSSYFRYNILYTITQTAVHKYYNTWISKFGDDKVFEKDNVLWSDFDDDKETTAEKYIEAIKNSGKTYNAKIYFLQKTGDTETFAIQNLILVEIEDEIQIPVTKVWNDSVDITNRRKITVKLLANGDDTGKTLKLNSDNSWQGTFTELDKTDSSGNDIIYTIEEISVAGYDSEITGDQSTGFTITNTLKTTSISVTKSWYDDNDVDQIRPTAITVKLYENNTEVSNEVTLNAQNNWTYTFTNLPEYKNGTKITYTVKEIDTIDGYTSVITGDVAQGFTITNIHEPEPKGYVEITGTVWKDGNGGKANEINGKLDSNETRLQGIKVILKDVNGNPIKSIYTDENGEFTRTDYALTQEDGTYTIRVNYDNSLNVYKLYEDADTVKEKLKTAYVEFEYDASKYTTVATATSGADTSKAQEDETTRNVFDGKYGTVTLETEGDAGANVKITASTQNVIPFETYADKTTTTRAETVRYCNGNGTHIRTNPSGAWLDVRTDNNDAINHEETCSNKQHILKTQDIEVGIIPNVNLGLFEREQPDVAIFSDISKVKVTMQGQEYTYLYNVRSNEKNNVGLKVKFENKDTYTYQRPVNPADIAYINETNNDLMSVDVTYEVTLANLSTTLPVTIHNIRTYFDNRYTLTTTGWTQNAGEEFSTATKVDGLNVTVNPGTESEKIELTYSISLEAIRNLLNENATLNHAVEIEGYSTKYGANTLYAEQRTGGRNNQPYGGYDNDSHPGNAGIHINDQGRLAATNLEDDTDIAPSFVLCKDERYYKVLSGNVWEDSDSNAEDGYRLGDGKKSDTDKNVENVKVELFKINDDGTLEIAKLHYLDTDNAEVKTKDAITYTDSNGNYAFGDENYSVVTDKYVIKFTYGAEIDGSVTSAIDGSGISARDYKSTIISQENINVYNRFKETDISDEWHLNASDGYSVAVDTIEERTTISDLQYSNFGEQLYITAWTKPFTMQLEFDPSVGKSTTVETDGMTIFHNELNIFDFGIIERAREDIFIETTVEHLKITLANGQVLTQGDPRVDELNYAKPIGFNQNIDNGTAARNALEKQILIEMDTELMQGAQLDVKYAIKVTNNSEKDIDIDANNDGQYKTEFYYFGTNNEGAKEVNTSINYVVDYLDSELTYTWENADDWQQKSADELLAEGLISEATCNAIKENDYATYITTKFSNLKAGESMTDYVNAKKLLANQDENIYDNHAEILKINAKTARTIKQTGASKEYKMGNYVPSLAARVINTDVNAEKAGLHEQDDDRLKIVITPPTGTTMYIITYVVTGLLGLIVIGAVIILIKKKVLTK